MKNVNLNIPVIKLIRNDTHMARSTPHLITCQLIATIPLSGIFAFVMKDDGTCAPVYGRHLFLP
jgi:hypothetical protein